MPFVDHLRELRRLLIISVSVVFVFSVVCFIFYDFILQILFRPFSYVAGEGGSETLYVNTLLEGFINKIKISLLTGFVISLPVLVSNIIYFVFPGLKGKEKRIIVTAVVISFLLLVFGGYYAYFRVIPISVRFLTNNSFVPERIGMLLNFGRNVFYIYNFIFGTIVLFQIPLLLEILMIMKILKRATLVKFTKYIIVGIFALSALLTPPDFVSQVTLAVPMIFLYLLTILIARLFRFGED
jgi:sec-independent protein translocase protein TatC